MGMDVDNRVDEWNPVYRSIGSADPVVEGDNERTVVVRTVKELGGGRILGDDNEVYERRPCKVGLVPVTEGYWGRRLGRFMLPKAAEDKVYGDKFGDGNTYGKRGRP